MAEALADRLAEAYAEKVKRPLIDSAPLCYRRPLTHLHVATTQVHELVRREYWGYAPEEKLSVDDMLKVKYQVS